MKKKSKKSGLQTVRKPIPLQFQFSEVASIVHSGRFRAASALNSVVIETYWKVGEYISRKVSNAEWGEGVVTQLADYLQIKLSDPRGFSARNLWRMRQFYDLYGNYEKLSTLLTQLPWSAHLHIISKTKTHEEREYYLHLAIQERYDVRALGRAIDSRAFDRTVKSKPKLSAALRELHPGSEKLFRDFLRCLVAFELKIDEFKPEYLGKLSFYLEALDRDVKKPHENPSIGIILCKGKDDEVVEYSLSRTL
jgi:predicted nuclease of restriction endonuclease-like (RecB) superfamily